MVNIDRLQPPMRRQFPRLARRQTSRVAPLTRVPRTSVEPRRLPVFVSLATPALSPPTQLVLDSKRPLKRKATEIFGPLPSSSRKSHRRSSERTTSESTRRPSREESGDTRKRSTHRKVPLARSRSMVRIELEKEVALVKRNISTKKTWAEALEVMGFVVVNTAISIAVAVAVAFSASFVPRAPGSEAASIGGLYTTACIVGTLAVCGSLAPLRRPVRRSWLRLLIALIATVGAAFGLSKAQTFVTHPLSVVVRYLRLCVLTTIGYCFVLQVVKTVWHPQVSPSASTVSPLDLSGTSVDKPTSSVQAVEVVKTPTPAVVDNIQWRPRSVDAIVPFLALHASILYLFVSSVVVLSTNWELLFFSCLSLALKLVLQEAAKHFQLHPRRPRNSLVVHAAISVPTISIDAQIRLVYMRLGAAPTWSPVTSSVAIVCAKMLFRTAKIWRLRHVISTRIGACTGMHRILKRVHSKTNARDLSAARAEYSQFLEWRDRILRVHAAEVYADMHGEYIAIGATLAILFFLGADIMALGDTQLSLRGVVPAVCQASLGLAGDYVLSVIEGVHEVPLYETVGDDDKRFRPFLRTLLGVLAGLYVAAVVTFYAK